MRAKTINMEAEENFSLSSHVGECSGANILSL